MIHRGPMISVMLAIDETACLRDGPLTDLRWHVETVCRTRQKQERRKWSELEHVLTVL